MGDFFSRLAEKALGIAPAVKPDLAPLFAASPQTESVAQAIPQEEQVTIAPSPSAPAARTSAPLDSPEEIVPTDNGQARVAPRRANSPAAVAMSRRSRSAETFADEPAMPADERNRQSTESSLQISTRDRAEPARIPRPSDTPVNLALIPISRPSVQPIVTSEPSSRISEAAMSTIKVSIGRVEVRAIVPSSAGPRIVERKAPERQTLEQYLRARNERRR